MAKSAKDKLENKPMTTRQIANAMVRKKTKSAAKKRTETKKKSNAVKKKKT